MLSAGLRQVLFGSATPYRGAMLALDFAGSSRTGRRPYYMLNGRRYARISDIPGWTYTGGTAAGTGSYAARQDGSLQFFPSYTNLILQSQTFDNGSWVKTGAPTITADATSAPNGTTTADLWTRVTTAASFSQQTTTKAALSVAYTLSYYAKPSVGNYLAIRLQGTYPARADVVFNLSTGAISSAATAYSGFASVSASIAPASNGFYFVTLSGTTDATTTLSALYSFNSNGTVLDGIDSASNSAGYIWGAQLELGSTASTYIPTTTAAVTVGTPRITDAGYWAEEARTNLLLRSQEFDNGTNWVVARTAVTANQVVAPDGTTTADKLDETATTGTHVIAGSATVTTATVYTYTVYLKAGERNYAALYEGAKGQGKFFNLSTGAVMGNLVAAPDSATITSAGNGWWRCSITVTTASTTAAPSVYVSTDGTTFSYAGTAGSGIYIWQADLQAGSFATSPIPTTSVAVTRAADVGYVSGLVVPSAWTMVASATVQGPSGIRTAASLTSGATANRTPLFVRGDNVIMLQVDDATVNQYYGDASTATAGQTYSAAARLVTGDIRMAAKGALSTTATAGTVPTASLNRLVVGADGSGSGSPAQGPIRRIVIYPRAFGNSELQAITLPTAA